MVRVFNGTIKKGSDIEILSKKEKYTVEKLGIFNPKQIELEELTSGQVGFLCASIKDVRAVSYTHLRAHET